MVFAKNVEEYLELIREDNDKKRSIIKKLRKENKELQEKNYKDRELQKMKVQLEKIQKDFWRGFPISEKEQNSILEWTKKHDEQDHGYTPSMRMKAEGCCGGRYKYVFIPTSLGISGKIVCHCGSEFEFQEIGQNVCFKKGECNWIK